MTAALLGLWGLVLAVLSAGLWHEVRLLSRSGLSHRAHREAAIRATVYAAALMLTAAICGALSASILL